MRKTRSDSKLLSSLDEAQQAQLAEMLLDGMPYHKAREVIATPPPDGFGVKVSLSAFSSFWERACVPQLLVRRTKAVRAANAIAEAASTGAGVTDVALIDALKQKALEVCMQSQASSEDISFLMGQVLKIRDQNLKADQLALQRQRFEFDAAAACLKKLPELKAVAGDNRLDHDAKLKAIRKHLFGVVPEE